MAPGNIPAPFFRSGDLGSSPTNTVGVIEIYRHPLREFRLPKHPESFHSLQSPLSHIMARTVWSSQAQGSGLTKYSRCWERVEWVRCIAPLILGSIASLPSRFFRRT